MHLTPLSLTHPSILLRHNLTFRSFLYEQILGEYRSTHEFGHQLVRYFNHHLLDLCHIALITSHLKVKPFRLNRMCVSSLPASGYSHLAHSPSFPKKDLEQFPASPAGSLVLQEWLSVDTKGGKV